MTNRKKGFGQTICTDCAYRQGRKCTLNDKPLWALFKCPDGYTFDTLSMLRRDKEYHYKTGGHLNEYINWETTNPNAPYPELSQAERMATV